MASNFVNPLASVASFKNQQLAPINNQRGPSVGTNLTAGNQEQQDSTTLGKPSLDGLKNVSQRASRQHNLYLQAVKAQRRREQPKVQYMNGGGNYSYKGGPAGQGLVGRYNLVPGANNALGAMNAAFQKQFGYGLQINSGGRTRQEQQYLYDLYRSGRGNLAARPGTSVHESGRALDFGGAIQNANSREHRWLQQNAHVWGFKWTGKNFSQFEPWHWEWHG